MHQLDFNKEILEYNVSYFKERLRFLSESVTHNNIDMCDVVPGHTHVGV